MITVVKNYNTFTADGKPVTVTLYRGNSTDTKPVDCANGSEFEEIDTSDKYLFDGASAEWVKKNSSVSGGLPTPTAADNGKAVIVSAQPTEGAVIVPEQSAYTSGQEGDPPVPMSDADASAFVADTEVIATIDGVKYDGTMVDQGGAVGVGFADFDYYFFNDSGTVLFGSAIEGTHTVKLSAKGADSVGYGFGGSTLLVHASNVPQPPESGTEYIFPSDTVLDKTYNEMKNALLVGRTVTLIASMSDGDGEMIYALGLLSLTSFDGEYNATFAAYENAGAQYFGFFTSYDPDDPMIG